MAELSAEKDPLSWWKTNESSTLPLLSEFARRYLCIAVSSFAPERVFSTSGMIVSQRHSRLTQDKRFVGLPFQNLELARKSSRRDEK